MYYLHTYWEELSSEKERKKKELAQEQFSLAVLKFFEIVIPRIFSSSVSRRSF